MAMTASEMGRKRWQGVSAEDRRRATSLAVSAMWKRLSKAQRKARMVRAAQTRKANRATLENS